MNRLHKELIRFRVIAFSLILITVPIFGEGLKVALVIGNGAYRTDTVSPLINPPNDARDVSEALRSIGFEVDLLIDGTREEMGLTIERFSNDLRGAEVGLFYYAGHGVQVEGTNYLIPVDADLPNANVVRFRTIAADEVLAFMEAAGASLNLFILDACRDNPLPQASRTIARGLAAVSRRPPETMIIYATAADAVAADGTGRNSPFTRAFLTHLPTPGLDVYDLYRKVSSDVQKATDGVQRPEQFGNVTVEYFLVSPQNDLGSIRVSAATAGTIYMDGSRATVVGEGESEMLQGVSTGSRNVEIHYIDGETERQSVSVRTGGVATVSFSYVPPGYNHRPIRDEILVEAGTFSMGTPSGGDDDERPVHRVTLDSFFMMRTEVTVADFAAFVNAAGFKTTAETSGGGYVFIEGSWKLKSDANWRNPYFDQGNNQPVVLVSWYDAVTYANWLSERDGLEEAYRISDTEVIWIASNNGWRLPTEAEWEYAARGGRNARDTKYAGFDEEREIYRYANFADASTDFSWSDTSQNDGYTYTAPVGRYQPNELGLYDMSGNVWEWCWDWYYASYYEDSITNNPNGPGSGTYRVLRGGCWYCYASYTRVANRFRIPPSYRYLNYGFRLVRPGSPIR